MRADFLSRGLDHLDRLVASLSTSAQHDGFGSTGSSLEALARPRGHESRGRAAHEV